MEMAHAIALLSTSSKARMENRLDDERAEMGGRRAEMAEAGEGLAPSQRSKNHRSRGMVFVPFP